MASNLYLSVIMTPVPYPQCFSGYSNIQKIIERNDLDINSVANTLGEFLNSDTINYLYLMGTSGSDAEKVFNCLQMAIGTEEEMVFVRKAEKTHVLRGKKKVILCSTLKDTLRTRTREHRVLTLNRRAQPHGEISREEFASFIYCGNSSNGPMPQYRCQNRAGILCVRGGDTCNVCFASELRPRMREVPIENLNPPLADFLLDEGIVVEPLNTCKEVFNAPRILPPEEDSDMEVD